MIILCRRVATNLYLSRVLNMASPKEIIHYGGCHCGKVRYKVKAPAVVVAFDCKYCVKKIIFILHKNLSNNVPFITVLQL